MINRRGLRSTMKVTTPMSHDLRMRMDRPVSLPDFQGAVCEMMANLFGKQAPLEILECTNGNRGTYKGEKVASPLVARLGGRRDRRCYRCLDGLEGDPRCLMDPQEFIETLCRTSVADGIMDRVEISGFSLDEIAEVEDRMGLKFPEMYREYLRVLGKNRGGLMKGTHLSPKTVEVLLRWQPWAAQLMARSGAEDSLPPNAVVFADHQGYQFWYFVADPSDEDPPVYYYLENNKHVQRVNERFSEFLLGLLEEDRYAQKWLAGLRQEGSDRPHENDYPALYQLFGALFNQDWKQLYGTPEGALNEFVNETTKEQRACVVKELDRLLAWELDASELESIVHARLGLAFDPAGFGFTLSGWLSWVRDQLNR